MAAVLGAADGLTLAVSLVIGLHRQQGAIFHSALSAGIGEFVGMGAALWLSEKRNLAGFLAALACGIATALACIVPALPYAFGLSQALWLSAGLCVAVGAVVCWLREERGLVAVAETYGVLGAAAVLCWLASMS